MADPSAHWRLSGRDVTVAETAISFSVLRVRAAGDGLFDDLEKAFAIAWPSSPNTVVGEDPRVAWLAPGEWALFDTGERLAPRLSSACQGRLCHLADVSAGQRLFRIEGARGRDLLAKGCSLDTHSRVFGPGRCARTLLAQIGVLLVCAGGGDAIEVIADASLAGHLRAWFTEAVREFQP